MALGDGAPLEPSTPPNTSAASSRSFCEMTSSSFNLLLDGINFVNMDNIYSLQSYSNGQSTLPTTSTVASDTGGSTPRVITCSETTASESTGDQRTGIAGVGWQHPLHLAAQKGHDGIVRALLQHKADCNMKDSEGVTPLIRATIRGHKDVVSLLLSHGAQLDKVDRQRRSALHWAVINRRETLLKVLLDHSAGERTLIDGYDESGKTPLHLAIDGNFEAGVQLFLQFGADVHSRARKNSLEP